MIQLQPINPWIAGGTLGGLVQKWSKSRGAAFLKSKLGDTIMDTVKRNDKRKTIHWSKQVIKKSRDKDTQDLIQTKNDSSYRFWA